MNEESLYLGTVDPPVYLRWHAPVGEPRGAVVICSPFAEEKKAAQRALVEASRALATAGFGVARFDYRGTGDSGGEFGEFDLGTRTEDVVATAQWVTERCPEVPLTLLGLRLGGALAHLAAVKRGGVDSLVLWEPVVSGSTYLSQNRRRSAVRSELTSGEQGVTDDGRAEAWDFDGFAVNLKLQTELAALELREQPVPARRMLLLQVSGSSRIKKPLQELSDVATQSGVETTLETVAVESFWSAIGWVDTTEVWQPTIAWLTKESG